MLGSQTFLNGDDCCGEPAGEENDSFLFLLGVRTTISRGGLSGSPCSLTWEALVKAGPRRFMLGHDSTANAWRLVRTEPLRVDRGVKNLLNERGVTGGGRFGLIRVAASDATDGGGVGSS